MRKVILLGLVLMAILPTVCRADETKLELTVANEPGQPGLRVDCPINAVCDENDYHHGYIYSDSRVMVRLSFKSEVIHDKSLEGLRKHFDYMNLEIQFPEKTGAGVTEVSWQNWQPIREIHFDSFDNDRLKWNYSGLIDHLGQSRNDGDLSCRSDDIIGECGVPGKISIPFVLHFDLSLSEEVDRTAEEALKRIHDSWKQTADDSDVRPGPRLPEGIATIEPSPEIKQRYADQVRIPNTGINRILERGKFEGVISQRGGGAYFSFTTRSNDYNQSPDLELQNGSFNSGFAGGDLGIVRMLSGMKLDQLTLSDLPSELTMEDAFDFAAYELRSRWEPPLAEAGSVYVICSVRWDESDLLAAFEVVDRDSAGATFIWRVLKQFPVPTLRTDEGRKRWESLRKNR